LRSAYSSMCLLLIVLSLLTAIFSPCSLQITTRRLASGRTVLQDSHLRFLRPLQAVNDSQALNEPVQVGAWGDAASVGNTGVQVEIQTNAYNVSSQQDDAFWVGDVLRDGSFVQFGYLMLPAGNYCLTAHITEGETSCLGTSDNVEFSDARWFWAYFPNAGAVYDWYYGFGQAASAGANSTWHLYSISPNVLGDWSFLIDDVPVYTSNFPSAASTSPAHLVAEKASGPYMSQLGPVEFRNLAYLGNDSIWHATSSLSLIDGCGAADNNPCSVPGIYGVESVGSNDVIAGTLNQAPEESSQIIWERQSNCALSTRLSSFGSVGDAPLNVTFIDSVSSPQGSIRTDWWFGDGFHESGSSNQTVTYSIPGNYTPLVRVLDSVGCLSEASGEVSVAAANSSTVGTATISVSLFDGVFRLPAIVSQDSPPNE